jgi:hypothetical protein
MKKMSRMISRLRMVFSKPRIGGVAEKLTPRVTPICGGSAHPSPEEQLEMESLSFGCSDGSIEVFTCMPGSALGYSRSMFELEFAWRNSMSTHDHMRYWPQKPWKREQPNERQL